MSHILLTAQDRSAAFYAVPHEPVASEPEQPASPAHHQHRGLTARGNAAYRYSDTPIEYSAAGSNMAPDRPQDNSPPWQIATPASTFGHYRTYSKEEGKYGQPQVHIYALPQGGTPEEEEERRQLDVQNRTRPNYKPSALRWPFLSILLLALVAMMALLAYGLRMLPVEDVGIGIPDLLVGRREALVLFRRQDESASTSTSTPSSMATSATPTITSTTTPAPPTLSATSTTTPTSTFTETSTTTSSTTDTSTSSADEATSTRPSGAYGDVGSVTITLTSSSSSSSSSSLTSVQASAPSSNFGNVETSITYTTYLSAQTSDFGHVGSVTITDSDTTPPTPIYIPVGVTTLTDSLGAPISTSTSTPPVISTPTTTVLTNSLGQPTATSVTSVLVTPVASTVTNADGVAIATVTRYPVLTPVVSALTNAEGVVTATVTNYPGVTPVVSTLTNAEGVATATVTNYPGLTPVVNTLTNAEGLATATVTSYLGLTPVVSTLTNSEGIATATVTNFPVTPSGTAAHTEVIFISYREYFVGFFLPTLLSILIAIPVRILDLNAKLFQPWHELTHADGATGRESLCLETSGWQSVVTSVRALFGGQALVFLTTILLLSSSLLIPLSAEAVALRLHGGCQAGSMSAKGCAYELAVFSQPAKATMVLLGFMVVTIILLIIFLAKWQSGVSTNPWSICGIAGLSQNKDVRSLFTQGLPAGVDAGKLPEGLLKEVLGEKRFTLGWFNDGRGGMEYGIILQDQYPVGHPLHSPITDGIEREKPRGHAPVKTRHHLPFLMLGYLGRLLFLFVLLGILVLILYYNNTGGDTPFERFMDSESFGVKFLFTAVGVLITFFWSSFFSSIAIMSPYHLLAARPQLARHSILLAPPTNAFSGIVSGFRRRHTFFAVVGVTTVLSEFLTIFLSNIPFRVTQTFLVSRVCTWIAVAILSIMVLVVLGSFFVKWPHMPVDPSTIAGAMYYICDSWILDGLHNIGAETRRDRDWRIDRMGERYEFGEMTGQSGRVRVGVDSTDGTIGA